MEHKGRRERAVATLRVSKAWLDRPALGVGVDDLVGRPTAIAVGQMQNFLGALGVDTGVAPNVTRSFVNSVPASFRARPGGAQPLGRIACFAFGGARERANAKPEITVETEFAEEFDQSYIGEDRRARTRRHSFNRARQKGYCAPPLGRR